LAAQRHHDSENPEEFILPGNLGGLFDGVTVIHESSLLFSKLFVQFFSLSRILFSPRLTPLHAVTNPPQILTRMRLAQNKEVFMHDEVELKPAGFAGPAAGVFAIVLGFDDLLLNAKLVPYL
jgi:hypothetical protein